MSQSYPSKAADVILCSIKRNATFKAYAFRGYVSSHVELIPHICLNTTLCTNVFLDFFIAFRKRSTTGNGSIPFKTARILNNMAFQQIHEERSPVLYPTTFKTIIQFDQVYWLSRTITHMYCV